jgi:hypothetical protein
VNEHPGQPASGQPSAVGPEHEVINEQLRAPVEELGQRLRPVLGLEAVLLVDGNPRQRLPLPGELVAPAGELFLLCQKRGPGGQPLLARAQRVLAHLVRHFVAAIMRTTARRAKTHRREEPARRYRAVTPRKKEVT